MTVAYPKGLSDELASRLYGSVHEEDWAETAPFTFDLERSECRFWLAQCAKTVPEGKRYDDPAARWPNLVRVIRRGSNNSVRVFQWAGGLVFEQTT